MANDIAIRMEGVSVLYRLPRERLSGIKEYAIRFLQRRLEYQDFWALRDVSLEVNRGEVFGVIGRNGAGKSTLLKVIAKVLFPSRGRVVIHGRVAPLLEIGAGFQPELTGRENVFLNSTLLGRTRHQTEQLLPEILEFAELEDFIEAPLRTYSTGMAARLGFAVATCLRPEILLVDEVLSVGDAQFQKKCLDRMYSFLDQGTTVVIVSHSMGTIESFCTRAMWLNHGRVEAYGSSEEVAHQYVQRYRALAEPEQLPEPADLPPGTGALQSEAVAVSSSESEGVLASVVEPEVMPVLDLPPVPEGPSMPTWSEARNYILYPNGEGVYSTAEALNIQHGSVTAWVRFRSDQRLRLGIIFHSDDSRYVIYTEGESPEDGELPIPRLTARAGGNRRVVDTFYGDATFPEISVRFGKVAKEERNIDGYGNGEKRPLISFNEWHLVCMTWNGYPEGRVRLHVDGEFQGETVYDRRHDNRYRLASQIAIGHRPREWLGELVQSDDGTLVDLRPEATSSVVDSGVELYGVRLYQHTLTTQEIDQLVSETKPD